MEKNERLHQGIFNWIKGHRKLISCLLMIFAVVAIILPQIILRCPLVDSNKTTGIELMLYCSQIISALFVIAGTIIAVWQYYLSSSKRLSELQFSRVEKAIELSNYYKDNILDRYSFVKFIFGTCGITEMLEAKRGQCELKEFDIIELNKLYTAKERKKFHDLKEDPDFINAVVKASIYYNVEFNRYEEILESDGKKTIIKISAKQQQQLIADFFKVYITQTLNNAEYFAMAFTHNTADESVIYQSIYPTFLEMCFVMYYYIAERSDPSKAKLYTNIAELYRVWRDREQEQIKEREVGIRKGCNKKGTVVNTDN